MTKSQNRSQKVLNFGTRKASVSSISSSRVIRFSTFEVNLHTGELRQRGQKIRLQEQPLQLLAALLERPGELVSREELRGKLWPADTFVDFDHSLNAAIKRLRDALGESAERPIFVETVARRGYRFIGNVETPAATPSAQSAPWHRVFTARNVVAVGSVVCAFALSFILYRHSIRSKAVRTTVTPAVTNIGEKYTPALSPDGQHLAFAWNGGAGAHVNLYVKAVGAEESLRLTKQASIDFNPVWSPDGRYLAFCRILKGATGIYVVPASGGAERMVRNTLWEEREFFEGYWDANRLSWSPDGKLLAYSDLAPHGENVSIFLLSLDSLEVRRLTSPPPSSGDFNGEFSPDGQTLAFARSSSGVGSIYTIPVLGGEEQRLTSGTTFIWGLAWAPDGREIVFANDGWLWKIPIHGGEPERLQFGQEGIEPSIRGTRLVYVRRMPNFTIWRRSLNSLVRASPPDRFISSTRMESGPQFSPDGGQITFESTRSGAYEIWLCRSDGSRLLQLTHLSPSGSGTPRWSPDGRQIAFDSGPDGNPDIFVIDFQGGPPHKLTGELSAEVVPSWSRDGLWIYYASNRTGGWEVWKMPSEGGSSVRVTRHGGFAAFESPDGKFLYYAKGARLPGLWRVPTTGGEEVEVIDSLEAGYWGYWAVVENGIYYLDTTAKPGIAFFEIVTHRTMRVFDLESRPAREVAGLAVSPDKSTILYTQLDSSNSDILLVESSR
jgi:Tol biopolymer transport system component/DNA-binding winged helix-turn-helix (wHTH) protein